MIINDNYGLKWVNITKIVSRNSYQVFAPATAPTHTCIYTINSAPEYFIAWYDEFFWEINIKDATASGSRSNTYEAPWILYHDFACKYQLHYVLWFTPGRVRHPRPNLHKFSNDFER